MNWTEVKVFTTTEGIEPVCGRLLVTGITGFQIKDARDFEDFLNDKTGNWDYIDDDLMDLAHCETQVIFYLADDPQGAEMLKAVKSEMEQLAASDTEKKFGRLTCELSGVNEEDWANNWKQYFKPLAIGERLVIKPSWEEYNSEDSRVILEIDPGSSFGTGQHETTRLCLELLEKTLAPKSRILDLGCGSGILSIAALLLGADSAAAADIDLNSVNIAKENALKNGISADSYAVYCGDITSDETLRNSIGTDFDIITANIVADVLIAMSPYFSSFLAPGGKIIISGIITERSEEVLTAMKEKGFSLLETNESSGWAAALLEVRS